MGLRKNWNFEFIDLLRSKNPIFNFLSFFSSGALLFYKSLPYKKACVVGPLSLSTVSCIQSSDRTPQGRVFANTATLGILLLS